MNEHIDLLLTSAKCISRNDPWAHIATHSISAAYNIGMIGYYGYQLGLSRAAINGGISSDYLRSIERERTKHMILAVMDCLSLLIKGIELEGRSECI